MFENRYNVHVHLFEHTVHCTCTVHVHVYTTVISTLTTIKNECSSSPTPSSLPVNTYMSFVTFEFWSVCPNSHWKNVGRLPHPLNFQKFTRWWQLQTEMKAGNMSFKCVMCTFDYLWKLTFSLWYSINKFQDLNSSSGATVAQRIQFI